MLLEALSLSFRCCGAPCSSRPLDWLPSELGSVWLTRFCCKNINTIQIHKKFLRNSNADYENWICLRREESERDLWRRWASFWFASKWPTLSCSCLIFQVRFFIVNVRFNSQCLGHSLLSLVWWHFIFRNRQPQNQVHIYWRHPHYTSRPLSLLQITRLPNFS